MNRNLALIIARATALLLMEARHAVLPSMQHLNRMQRRVNKIRHEVNWIYKRI